MSKMARICPIDLRKTDKSIFSGHLRLGGSDARGNVLGVTNYYLTWNGEPYFPVSGEFHFSRYPQAFWNEELRKIKAGGINTVATYVFWIFHEEKQGVFEWAGQKDLRRFIELCAENDLKVVLRAGPFGHGEWRNGGLPDWLYGQPFEVRSNDLGYLAFVERYYAEISKQVRGLLFKDGGPIIGLQIENEYMHAGAPWEVVDPVRETEWINVGSQGVGHLKSLKNLAVKAGLDVPIYLVTAWESPILEEETLPVYGGYAYPVWLDNPPPSEYFRFKDSHALPAQHPTHRVPYHYPVVYAELQGGIQIRYRNRPIVPPESTEAMSLVAIGGGSNWLGYYMFHGGTTPVGGHGFSHERLHPQLSYDAQAPLGEYGELRRSYHSLKLIHHFLAAYGKPLCSMGTILPEKAETISPDDTESVRYCARARDGLGFLFVNNFQDHVEMRDHEGIVFEILSPRGALRIPGTGTLTIPRGVCFVLPIHQMLGDARLVYATAQPLTILRYSGITHYFYFVPDGLEAEYCFEENTLGRFSGDVERYAADGRVYIHPEVGQQSTVTFTTVSDQKVMITTLTRQEAESAWVGVAWGAERVILTPAGLTFVEGGVEARLMGVSETDLTVWPVVDRPIAVQGARCEQTTDQTRTMLRLSAPAKNPDARIEQVGPWKFLVTLRRNALEGLSDVFLRVNYEGDTGMAFLNGRLVADHFNNGTAWIIGLKRFAPESLEKGLCLVFHPLRSGIVENVSSPLAGRSKFEGQEKLNVQSIAAIPEYCVRLSVGVDGTPKPSQS